MTTTFHEEMPMILADWLEAHGAQKLLRELLGGTIGMSRYLTMYVLRSGERLIIETWVEDGRTTLTEIYVAVTQSNRWEDTIDALDDRFAKIATERRSE